MGLGYKGKVSSAKTVFVSRCKLKKPEVIEKKTGIRAGTRSGPSVRRWVPLCHYFECVGHIRPICYQYLADLRKIGEKKPQGKKITGQVWRKKM